MTFHKTKKLLQMVSHDLGARNWKIVFHGIGNPRACPPMTRMTSQSLPQALLVLFTPPPAPYVWRKKKPDNHLQLL